MPEKKEFEPSENHWSLENFREQITEAELRYLLLDRPDPIKNGRVMEWKYKHIASDVYEVWLGEEEEDTDGDSPFTVIRWEGTTGHQHRIQTHEIPGSEHWAIVKDSRGPGGSWTRDWGTEARSKPTFKDWLDEIPSDTHSSND